MGLIVADGFLKATGTRLTERVVTRLYLRSRLATTVFCAACGSLVAVSAGAQQAQADTTLNAIVVSGESARGPDQGMVAKRSRSASKTDTSLLETPQAVSVVTRDQIDAQGANTVAESLRYTPGILPDPNGYDIRYDWLYIRGFNAYGTMWLDGLVQPGDPSNYATPTINPYALERVEVIKGPASVLYGRSLPGGLINQVGKRPQTEAHREVSVGVSGFGGAQTSMDFTGPISEGSDWSYRLVGQARNLHTQIDHERDRQLMIAPSLTWAPSDNTSLTLHGYYQKDDPVFNPRFYPAYGTLLPNPAGQIPRDVFLGDPNWGGFERDYFNLGYEFEHSFDETWTVRQNLRYGRADQHMDLVLANPAFVFSGAPSSNLNRVTAISDDMVSSFTVDNQAEAKFATGGFDHTVLFGIDYVHAVSSTNFGNYGAGVPGFDYNNPIYGYDFPVAPVTASGRQAQDQIGLYLQDQIRYGGWLGTFGLRYDMSEIESRNRINGRVVTTKDNELSWRAGLTYLFDNGLAPYVSYSTAFLPSMGVNPSGNPLKAQTVDQFEIGVKYEPVEGRGMIGLSLFDLEHKNALTSVGTNIYDQNGKQRVRGVEIEGKYELTPEIDVLASYAYSDSKVLSSVNAVSIGKPVLRLPEHQATIWMNYRPEQIEGLSLNAGVRYLSSYNTATNYNPLLLIPSRTLVDIGASYDFGALDADFKGTKLQFNVSNLFDEKYVSHCLNLTGGSCNYGAGRTFSASLKYSW